MTTDDLTLLKDEFVPEARDLLEAAGEALLALEADPSDAAATNRLFRAVHTIKGTAGIFDLPSLVTLVHAAEDLLVRVRDGRLAFSADMADDLLAGLDDVRGWIDALEAHGALPADSAVVARVRAAAYRARLEGDDTFASAAPTGDAMAAAIDPAILDRLRGLDIASATLVTYRPAPDCFFNGEDPLRTIREMPGRLWFNVEAREPWPASEDLDPYACNLAIEAASSAPVEALEQHFRYVLEQVTFRAVTVASPSAAVCDALDEMARQIVAIQLDRLSLIEPPWDQRAPSALATLANVLTASDIPFDRDALNAVARQRSGQAVAAWLDTILGVAAPSDEARDTVAETRTVATPAEPVLKVDQRKIDQVMNLVGELVVAKNSLPYLASRAENEFGCRVIAKDITDRYAVLDRIAQELQGAVMSVRMLPVGDMFRRFPRLVRDISRKLGKSVELKLEGERTEADKNVLEALADPLVHILRNSLDHGVETPDERVAAGKAATATIRLAARQDGDSVIIEVVDDGRGIDPDRVRAKAVAKGLVTADDAARLGDHDAQQLIFAPGFSTAEAISDLSGRGVGMDVVRTTVEGLRGDLVLTSEPGRGTRILLRLPLSVALTRVMTVKLGGQLFGIPMDVVAETVRLKPENIRRFKQAETFVLRDAVTPLVRLRRLLALPEQAAPEEAVLVIRVHGAPVGLVVDAFSTGMEVILKPLSGVLGHTPGYAGTAVLGDGDVLLILKPSELI